MTLKVVYKSNNSSYLHKTNSALQVKEQDHKKGWEVATYIWDVG